MSGKLVGIKFVLEGASFAIGLALEADAIKIITDWTTGTLKGDQIVAGLKPPIGGWFWSVRVNAIQAIHTFDPYQVPDIAARLPVQQPYQPRGSGL